jgi:uncharacterized protein YbcI
MADEHDAMATPAEADRSATDGNRVGGSPVAAISREIVGIHARFYGRGPTKAKTVWREEIVICILEDVFTKSEKVLVDGGRFADVRANRTAFQDETEPLFRGAVEAATGRRVASFLSQISEDSVACEVFVLGEPRGRTGD